ncbi:MAG: MFS transporter [Alphaproteobacteria bacterium]|nr:MFS transporter [Alphaproteobacteria bacterium]
MRGSLLSVFQHRNYRLYFFGQGISLIGFWMQAIALSWLVYRLTGSPLLLGLVSFAQQAPVFFISPFAGVIADRANRRRILFITQTSMMSFAFVLSTLTLTHQVQIWEIIGLAFCFGIANSFDIPTRQSFTVEMVGRPDLPRAIALNSVMFNGARLAGPSIAGIVVGIIGEGWCFALNGISYLGVIGGLALMRLTAPALRAPSHPLTDLREGFRYASTHSSIRLLLILLAGSSFFGAPYLTLMPVFARDILKGGPDAYGFLMAGVGAGALIGALTLSRLPQKWLPYIPFAAAAWFGLFLIAFSQSTVFGLSVGLLMPAGFGLMAQGISTNTLIQTLVDDAMRGRVMAYYVMCFMGILPFGALTAGWVSHQIGVPETVALGGALCMVSGATGFLVFKKLLPETASLRVLARKHGD